MTNPVWSEEEIKSQVRQRYASLVQDGASSCCGPAPEEGMKGVLVKLAGYSGEELGTVPDDSVQNSFGCGNPTAFAGVREGQTVLDIGSGTGIDCFLAARKVGSEGRVIGLDMTPEMIAKARENARKAGLDNVEFRLGDAESMPVEDSSVDWIISNCVINLSPDKPKVFREIARVLRPGGQISISDIVLAEQLPESVERDVRSWTGCVTGAISEAEYLKGLRDAGLTDVTVEDRLVYEAATLSGLLGGCGEGAEVLDPRAEALSGKVWSAMIRGRKP